MYPALDTSCHCVDIDKLPPVPYLLQYTWFTVSCYAALRYGVRRSITTTGVQLSCVATGIFWLGSAQFAFRWIQVRRSLVHMYCPLPECTTKPILAAGNVPQLTQPERLLCPVQGWCWPGWLACGERRQSQGRDDAEAVRWRHGVPAAIGLRGRKVSLFGVLVR